MAAYGYGQKGVTNSFETPGLVADLDPQLLQALLAQYKVGQPSYYQDFGIHTNYGYEGGDAGSTTTAPRFMRDAKDANGNPILDAEGKPVYDQFDQAGKWTERGGSTNSVTAQDWLMALAALGGAAAAGGAFGAAGAPAGGGTAGTAGATGGLTAAELEALTAIQQGGAFGIDGITGMTSFGDGIGALAGAGGAAGGAAGGGATNWADWAASEVAGASSNPATAAQLNAMAGGSGTPFMSSGGGGLFDGLGANASTLGKLAGAVLGAASAKDQQQTTTSSRDPWGPAQPFLKGLLEQGQTLNSQYQANPFSDAQKTSYNNLGGLLNTLNSQAGGLMGGFGANASGANNYDRSNPRKQLTGSSFNLSGFNPGLLNFFPRG